MTLAGVSPWVLHVDLDQFIAAVEVLRRPELQGLAVVVGGDGDPTKRGVVSTATYEAREYGVQSGLPLRTAVKRCPDAVFLPVDKEAYDAVSAEVMTTLRSFDAVVEVLGWDEAFLGVDTDDPEALARAIQQRVRQATELECTVGIGDNKLQAKLATGFGKPRGVYRLTHDSWYEVMGELSVDALWGIGRKTATKLGDAGITTVSALASADPYALAAQFGPRIGPSLILVARGRMNSPVVGTAHIPRSRGRETTFQQDLADWDEVRDEVIRLARRVADDVAAEGRDVARVVVKVRYRPFTTQTHGHTLAAPTTAAVELERAALTALEGFTERRPVRLLGVRAEFAD